MAHTRRAKASSFDDDEDNVNDDGDISVSFRTDCPQDRNEEFSLLSNMMSDLSFLLGREMDPSGLQLALKKQQQRIKKLLAEKRKQVQHQPQKIHGHLRRVVTGDENKRVRDLLAETRRKPKVVMSLDKIAFTGGVLNLMATEYILLLFPDYFWVYFCVLMPTLIALRYVYYSKKKMSWFMLDFCYFTQLSMVLFFVLAPHSCTWWKVNFLYSLGPLSWAIPVWRNSLVFHDLEKVTSVYLHTFPALACVCVRFVVQNPAVDLDSCGNIGFQDAAVSVAGYILWQALYYLETEVWDRDILDADPDQLTSLRWVVTRKSKLSETLLLICRKLRIFKQNEGFEKKSVKTKFIFMTCQFFFTLVAELPVMSTIVIESPLRGLMGSLLVLAKVALLYVYSDGVGFCLQSCHRKKESYLWQTITKASYSKSDHHLFAFVNFFTSNFYIEVFSRRYWDDVFKLGKINEEVEGVIEDKVLSPLSSMDSANGDTGFSGGSASQICPSGSNGHSSQQCIKED